jgi:hypothetical protein
MRKKREQHDKVVEKYKAKEFFEDNTSLFQKNMYSIHKSLLDETRNNDENEEEEGGDDEYENDSNSDSKNNEIIKKFDDEELIIKITNTDNNDGNNSNSSWNKNNNKRSKKAERRSQPIIDAEHFIPYKPKNFNQEKALGINTNFNRELADATFDLVGDDQEQVRKNMQKMKWDRKKKKFVSVQSTLDKAKKIKTESGSYIKASYKSNLYSKWLKNSKAAEKDDNDDDNEEGENEYKKHKMAMKNKKYFGSTSIGKIFLEFFSIF